MLFILNPTISVWLTLVFFILIQPFWSDDFILICMTLYNWHLRSLFHRAYFSSSSTIPIWWEFVFTTLICTVLIRNSKILILLESSVTPIKSKELKSFVTSINYNIKRARVICMTLNSSVTINSLILVNRHIMLQHDSWRQTLVDSLWTSRWD